MPQNLKKKTDAKLHVLIVTLAPKDNVTLTKQLSNGFKRSVHWNTYHIIPAKIINHDNKIYELLRPSFQGARRLFVLAYDATEDNVAGIKCNKKYFLP